MENSVVDDDPHQLAAISPDLVINTRGSIDGKGWRDRRERDPAEQRLRSSSQGATHGGQNSGTFGAQSPSGRRLESRSFDGAFIQPRNPCCQQLSSFLELETRGRRRVCVTTEDAKGNAQLRGEEGEAIDTKPTSGPTPGETEIAAKAYCKDHPSGIINLRSYSGDWYQQSCSELAARLQATTDPSYKTVPD
jgi:hypothetical protein